jgi:DNA-directed RNA polymerase subunit RPC12/RpoP
MSIRRARTFTVTAETRTLKLRCARCGRRILTGQRATVRVEPGTVTYTHAGRTCPAPYNPRPL